MLLMPSISYIQTPVLEIEPELAIAPDHVSIVGTIKPQTLVLTPASAVFEGQMIIVDIVLHICWANIGKIVYVSVFTTIRAHWQSMWPFRAAYAL